jgi:ribonuclease P protein component
MIAQKFRFHGYGSLRFVMKNGRVARSRLMNLKWASNPNRREPRIAVVVSKKIYKSAVKRNRIRRRLYEIIRLEMRPNQPVLDLALIVHSPEVLTLPSGELQRIVRGLLHQAGFLREPTSDEYAKLNQIHASQN